MANLSAISSAIGTQRQFAKQPQDLYQMRLIKGNYMAGINQRSDLDAQALISALKNFGGAIWEEHVSEDKRKREQATLVDADRMLAGKTKEDLKDFDRVNALQHAGEGAGFDLTDNKYAVAALDHAIGGTIAEIAKNEWYSDSQTEHPTTVEDAMGSFNKKLQDAYDTMSEGVTNKTAFDAGFNKGRAKASQQVMSEAHAQINDEARYKGQQTVRVRLQELAISSTHSAMPVEGFKASFGSLMRELQSYCKNSKEAASIIGEFMDEVVASDISTERLNTIRDTAYWGDRKIGDEINTYNYYKKVANNFNVRTADDIYDKCKRPDGTLDLGKASKMLSQLPKSFKASSIPQINIPLSDADAPDVQNIDPKLKASLGSVGGILANLGYGDDMLITSGYRDAERNARAGGEATSYHLTGQGVDIYVGENLSQEQQTELLNSFKPYYTEVMFHDAGSGYHLHLAGYQGGLDDKADPNELSASAYTPDRINSIQNMLLAKHNDAIRIRNQQMKEEEEQLSMSILTSDSQQDCIEMIKNSKQPLSKKKAMLNAVNKKFKNETNPTLSLEQQFWNNYEKGKGGIGFSLARDYATMKEYNRVLDSDTEVSDKLQEKADAACARINLYWEYSSGGTYNSKNNTDEGRDFSNENSEDYNIPTNTPSISQNKKNIEEAKTWALSNPVDKNTGKPLSRDEIKRRLMRVAYDYGTTPEVLIASIFGHDGD